MQSSSQPSLAISLIGVITGITILKILASRSLVKVNEELIPDEVLLNIFSYLQPKEIIKASAVSKRWRNIGNDQSLWKNLSRENYLQTQEFIHNSDAINYNQYIAAKLIWDNTASNHQIYILGTDEKISTAFMYYDERHRSSINGFMLYSKTIIQKHRYVLEYAANDPKTIEKCIDRARILIFCINDEKDYERYMSSVNKIRHENILCLLATHSDKQIELPVTLVPYSITIDGNDSIETSMKKIADKISTIANRQLPELKNCTII